MKTPRLLVCAYACEPHRGSEPGIGWNLVREVAKRHETWVVTREAKRPFIEAELAKNPVPQLNFVYYDLPPWRNTRNVASNIYYYAWQVGALLVARRIYHRIGLNLGHHVTYGRYWSPSFLALLPIPFIWGPVGGGESAPKAFWKTFGFRGIAYELLRGAARWLGEHDPSVRLTARRCALAFATTEETAARMRRIGAKDVQVLSGVALGEEIDQLSRYPVGGEPPVRFVSIGRLLNWKGFDLSVRAFAKARLSDAEYWIIGDGPERRSLEMLANNLEIGDKVRFFGELPREEVLAALEKCHALVHPSLHDSGGWVCLEAMAAGRPVICLDLGGPATQVTEQTGFKVAAYDPEQAADSLAEAMKELAVSQELRERMGEAARQRIIQEFSWSRRAERMSALYYNVMKSR